MTTTFDLHDCELEEEPLAELEAWAEHAISPPLPDNQPAILDIEPPLPDNQPAILDIETGPRPLEEIEEFYDAPDPLPPWDESMVKYGNAKREDLRAQKREEHRQAYQKQLDAEVGVRAAHYAAWLEKAALSPVTGRVLLIGMRIGGITAFFDGGSEADNLQRMWSLVDDLLSGKMSIIGHNIKAFDLPFLVRRSWSLGVHVPRDVRQGRFWNPLFRDTMETWNLGSREFITLNMLGQFFGVGQKTEGVHGGDFAKLWFGEMDQAVWGTPAQQRAKAKEYNGQDLALTEAIAAKMGML